jgi:NADPH:quinone reductase-like Zn-dependent oxidoreductase
VNFIDTYYRTGLYPTKLPTVLGSEAAGVVEGVGEGVTGFAKGERVAYGTGPLGAYAEARNVPAANLVKLVHAAAGGVGLIVCQWCKHLGATVIGTVGEEKATLARANGPLFLTRPTLADYVRARPDLESTARELFEVIASGAVKIHVAQTYPLRDAEQAHRDLEARMTTGSTLRVP